MTSTKRTT